MGLFGKKEKCCICLSNEGKYESLDGMVCQTCFSACGRFIPVKGFSLLKTFHKEEIIDFIKQNRTATERKCRFAPTFEIGDFAKFDDRNRLWSVNENASGHMKVESIVWSYDNFDNIQVIEDGNDIIQGGLGSAFVGGVLFGNVGAVVGSAVGKKSLKKEVKKLELRILLKESSISDLRIILIQSPTKSDNPTYKKMYDFVEEIVNKFTEIKNAQEVNMKLVGEVADEIMKLKNLFDIGAITQEEFDAKKKKVIRFVREKHPEKSRCFYCAHF